MKKLFIVILMSLLSFNLSAKDCKKADQGNKEVEFFAANTSDIFVFAAAGSWFGGDRCKSKAKSWAKIAVSDHLNMTGNDASAFRIYSRNPSLRSNRNTRWGVRKTYEVPVRVSDRVEIEATYKVRLQTEEKNGRCELLEVSRISGSLN